MYQAGQPTAQFRIQADGWRQFSAAARLHPGSANRVMATAKESAAFMFIRTIRKPRLMPNAVGAKKRSKQNFDMDGT